MLVPDHLIKKKEPVKVFVEPVPEIPEPIQERPKKKRKEVETLVFNQDEMTGNDAIESN
jgi:hypothetical protein